MSQIKRNQVIKQQTENVPSPVLGVASSTPSMIWQSGGLRSRLAQLRPWGLWAPVEDSQATASPGSARVTSDRHRPPP